MALPLQIYLNDLGLLYAIVRGGAGEEERGGVGAFFFCLLPSSLFLQPHLKFAKCQETRSTFPHLSHQVPNKI
ncbi:hypothetical protein [Microcoleus sp. OTE_8_concoct_300]|uniref:hypothetical protein n=1 Tax=Microcoleus sp. OTE_8_concoct_300 TaxID=2964710 RepID=UPI00403F32C3